MDLDSTLEDLAPKLLRYCTGLAPDSGLAEEAAQDALFALVGRWRRHGPPDCAAAFTFTIARRKLRRAQWRRRLWTPLEAASDGASPHPDPLQSTLERDRLARTRDALARLSTERREALLLVVAGELDGRAASKVLGISHSALKMRVFRARRQLQQILEESS